MNECPTCRRPNAVQRVSCLYCGTAMPHPQNIAAPVKQSVPTDFDQLVKKALSGGDVDGLKKALEAHQTKPSAAPVASAGPLLVTSSTVNASLTHRRGATVDPLESPARASHRPSREILSHPMSGPLMNSLLSAPETARGNAVLPESAFLAIVRLAQAAEIQWKSGENAATLATLLTIRKCLDAIEREISPPPTPSAVPDQIPNISRSYHGDSEAAESIPANSEPSVVLPPNRLPYLLLLAGLGPVDQASALASALQVDIATARLFCTAPHPRIVKRSNSVQDLEHLAQRVRDQLTIPATVCARSDLEKMGSAHMVMGTMGSQRYRVTTAPLWMMNVDITQWKDTFELDVENPKLAVWGDVEAKRIRAAAEFKQSRYKENSPKEVDVKRVQVVDLYTTKVCLRVVVGITDFAGFAGCHPTSSLLSYRGFIEALKRSELELQVEGKRVCAATEGNIQKLEHADTGITDVVAWPAWEEHSRACWHHWYSTRPRSDSKH